MKKLKQLNLAVVVSLVLSVSALAGEIEIGKSSTPPPPAPSSATTPGEIWIPGEIQIGAPSDPITEVALNLLQTVLSIF